MCTSTKTKSLTTTNRYSLKDLLKQYDATRFENFLNTVAYMLIPVADQAHALQDIFRKHSSDLDTTCSRQNASTDFEACSSFFMVMPLELRIS